MTARRAAMVRGETSAPAAACGAQLHRSPAGWGRRPSPTCACWPAAELRAPSSTTPMAPPVTNSLFVGLGDRLTRESSSACTCLRTCPPWTPRTVILGRARGCPVRFAPTSFTWMMHTRRRASRQRVAERTGILVCVISDRHDVVIEGLAAAAPDGRRWFQLYLWRDREASRDRPGRSRWPEALVLTVDTPVPGPRLSRDVRNGLTIPPSLSLKTFPEGALSPAWWFDLPTTEPLEFASLKHSEGHRRRARRPPIRPGRDDRRPRPASPSGPAAVRQGHPQCVRCPGGRRCRSGCRRRVEPQGTDSLRPGRTLLEALPSVVDAAGDRAEVYVDGGVMSGSYIAAAVALGARAALVGRAYLYGLMAGGERVRRAADILVQEVASTLALLGVTRVAELRPDHVQIRLPRSFPNMDVTEYTPTRDHYVYTFGGVASTAARQARHRTTALVGGRVRNGVLRSVDDLSVSHERGRHPLDDGGLESPDGATRGGLPMPSACSGSASSRAIRRWMPTSCGRRSPRCRSPISSTPSTASSSRRRRRSPAADAFGRDARRTPRESRLTRNDLRSPGDVATHTTLSSTPRKASAMDLQLTAKRVLATGGAWHRSRHRWRLSRRRSRRRQRARNWSKAICTYIPQHSS